MGNWGQPLLWSMATCAGTGQKMHQNCKRRDISESHSTTLRKCKKTAPTCVPMYGTKILCFGQLWSHRNTPKIFLIQVSVGYNTVCCLSRTGGCQLFDDVSIISVGCRSM